MTSHTRFPGQPIPQRWRDMGLAEREREYSPSSCLPGGDYRPFIEVYTTSSDRTWTAVAAAPDVHTAVVRYGRDPLQTIDVAVPIAGVADPPLLAFIHGGYWQELSKAESRFAAADCIRRGWAFAAIDYPLAPHADLDAIVDACRLAVRKLGAEADVLGFDAGRIVVAGSSAGAHLAAMAALDPDVPPDDISGTVLVSGVFELEPLIGTSIDEALAIDTATAARNSPLRADLTGFPPSLVAYGQNETDEFKAQSQAVADALDRVGTPVTRIEVVGRNHFDVILDLAAPGTALGDAVARLIDTTGDPHAHV